MTDPVFLTPLGIEAFAVRRGVRDATIERVGMGPVKATAARARLGVSLDRNRPVVMIGLGGGLLDSGVPGDVIVASTVQLLDSEEEIVLEGADRIVDALTAAGLRSHAAPVISSPKILHGADARSAAGARGAAVVDMEAYWCASLSETHAFSVCRILSDAPGQELWSLRTPSAVLRALRVIGTVARTVRRLSSATVDSRSVEEADL